jgi:hypothetical protein
MWVVFAASFPLVGLMKSFPTPVISSVVPLMTLLLLVNTGLRELAEILASPCRPTPPNAGPSPGAGEVATECSPHPPAGVAVVKLLASACEAAAERLLTVGVAAAGLLMPAYEAAAELLLPAREAALELRAPSFFGVGGRLDRVGACPVPRPKLI